MKRRVFVAVLLVALLAAAASAAMAAAATRPVGATADSARVSAGAWTPETSGTTGFLSGVSAVSPAVAYAVGQNATILRTINGGTTWTKLSTPLPGDEEVTDVDFVTSSTGYAIGAANAILKTTDGGATWTGTSYLGFTYPPKLLALSAPDATHVRIGGSDTTGGFTYEAYYSIVLGTNDGTKWWTSAPMVAGDYGHGVMGISFPDANRGWAVMVDGSISKTTDGGLNWTAPLTPESVITLCDIGFFDGANGWAVGQAWGAGWSMVGFVLHTADGGQTWYRQAQNEIAAAAIAEVDAICAVSPSVAWAACDGGYVLHTADGGATWAVEQPTTQDLKDVSFVDADTGWVVGSAGAILRHGAALPVDTVRPVTKALAAASVKRGRTATLKYRVVDAGGTATVVIKIKNSAGKVKKTLALGVQPCGAALKATFKASLSKGVYKWYVYATDAAGNKQGKAAWQKLTVK
jgi:photosystem II stability/assembly factor-like uncharacterized protein